jgi:hypothetical protein
MTRPRSVESDGIIDQLAVLMQHQETLPTMGSKASVHCGVPRREYPSDSCPGDDSTRLRGGGGTGRSPVRIAARRESPQRCSSQAERPSCAAMNPSDCVDDRDMRAGAFGITLHSRLRVELDCDAAALLLPGGVIRTSGYQAVTPDVFAARVHRGTTHIGVAQRAYNRSRFAGGNAP